MEDAHHNTTFKGHFKTFLLAWRFHAALHHTVFCAVTLMITVYVNFTKFYFNFVLATIIDDLNSTTYKCNLLTLSPMIKLVISYMLCSINSDNIL